MAHKIDLTEIVYNEQFSSVKELFDAYKNDTEIPSCCSKQCYVKRNNTCPHGFPSFEELMENQKKSTLYVIRADNSFVAIEATEETFEEMHKFSRALGVKSILTEVGMKHEFPELNIADIPKFKV